MIIIAIALNAHQLLVVNNVWMDTQDLVANAVMDKFGMLLVHHARHREILLLLLLDQVGMKIIDIKLILAMLIRLF